MLGTDASEAGQANGTCQIRDCPIPREAKHLKPPVLSVVIDFVLWPETALEPGGVDGVFLAPNSGVQQAYIGYGGGALFLQAKKTVGAAREALCQRNEPPHGGLNMIDLGSRVALYDVKDFRGA